MSHLKHIMGIFNETLKNQISILVFICVMTSA